MRAPYSWLTEFAQIPADPKELAARLTAAGLQIEKMIDPASLINGPVVVGRVLDFVDEPQKNGKVQRWCQVDTGQYNPEGQSARGIICGASNFQVGDYVAVVLPGTTLPGGFTITSRKVYGHISDGMICAEDELGIGEDHSGIIVLDPGLNLVVGQDALALIGAREVTYEIDVTPDSGHCLSIRGLAREAAQISDGTFSDPYSTPVPPEVNQGYPVVLESEDCQIFVALTVSGADPHRPTPAWMVNRLKAAGVRSISLLVDITNYVMIESGQPLHAYDAMALSGPIRVRKARAGERLTTLDHVDRLLSEEDLLITDDSGPIGLAGVMGGLTTELTPTTTDIVIEAAWFNPVSIGRTYRRHNLASEASRRFERGVDTNVAYATASRAAELFGDLAGATISEYETVVGTVNDMPTLVLDDVGVFTRILGVDLPQDKVVGILRTSGVKVVEEHIGLYLTPPTWRRDLIDPYDYIEEIGRKIGFDLIPSRVPSAPVGSGLTRAQKLRREAVQAVSQVGFVEVLTLPFIGLEDIDKLQLTDGDPRWQLVRLANPLSQAQPCMRSTLLPGLFAAVNRNTSRSLNDLALFESGLVFRATDPKASSLLDVTTRPSQDQIDQLYANLPDQPWYLAGVLTGNWRPATVHAPAQVASWVHAVHLAETAATAMGLELVRRKGNMPSWHPGRAAELGIINNFEFISIGWAGEIHPSVIETWDLPAGTCAVELNLDTLIDLAPSIGQIKPLSSHPATKQDLALVVDVDQPAAEIQTALVDGAGDLLESITLFDIYTGSQIGEGKKSLAFSLVFRAPDRTLTEVEASDARNQAVKEAHRRHGAVIRSDVSRER